jgi:hypothetical protein
MQIVFFFRPAFIELSTLLYERTCLHVGALKSVGTAARGERERKIGIMDFVC